MLMLIVLIVLIFVRIMMTHTIIVNSKIWNKRWLKIDAKVCDRCGTTYRFFMPTKVVDSAGQVVIEDPFLKKYDIIQKPDLCMDCQKQLNTILNDFFHVRKVPYDPLQR